MRGKAADERGARALVWMVGLILIGLSGCGRTSVESVDVKAGGLPRPQLIVVHDFAVSASAVALDSAIGAAPWRRCKASRKCRLTSGSVRRSRRS